MSDDRRVLAVIPVYHKYEQRDRCVAALERQTIPVEIFIHDNSTENIGFTKACNRGLREAFKRGCTYAMLLNQDCHPEPEMVERLVTFMEQHPRCAMAKHPGTYRSPSSRLWHRRRARKSSGSPASDVRPAKHVREHP
jgi:GT2 family glycosyltransferase